MSSATPEELIENIQSSLDPYIKTREEVAFVRRVLALHLESCLPDTTLNPPLSLVDPPAPPSQAPELRGPQREYIRALSANIKARQEFEAIRNKATSQQHAETIPKQPRTDLISHHLAITKLSRKLSRLQTVQKHLEQISSLPAASPDFLSPEAIAADTTTPLPAVPKSVISGVGLASAQRDVVRSDLNDLLNDLEKSVLRAKLTLKREEEALGDVKATSGTKAVSDPSAKLHALTSTRNELILWMETELSKAGDAGDDDDDDDDDDQVEDDPEEKKEEYEKSTRKPTRTPGGRLVKAQAKVEERRRTEIKLRQIKKQYAQYLESRKELIAMLERPSPTAAPSIASNATSNTNNILKNKPDLQPPKTRSHHAHAHAHASSSSTAEAQLQQGPGHPPQAHLLTPYLSSLLSLSREQKSLIQQKSHLNVRLSHAARDAASTLDRVAQESQLLPRYPMPKPSSKSKDGPGDGLLGAADFLTRGAESLQKVRAWRHAAGEAKIATLEVVTEHLGEGEAALKIAMGALDEADELMGVKPSSSDGEKGYGAVGDATEDDIWLAEEDGGGGKGKGRGLAERRRGKGKGLEKVQTERGEEDQDIWARLDGNLGGLNSP